jgi:Na+/H+-dicarboxylate symporter
VKLKLTTWIMIAMILGIIVGYICNITVADAKAAKDIASYFNVVTDIFLRLIKMIIAPLVFATLVAGIASMGDAAAVGRIGLKALLWFVLASLVSLALGLIMVDLLRPGANLALPLPEAGAATNLKTGSLNLKDFITQVFPKSVFEAMANNNILQILVFSIFFGFAIASLKGQQATTLVGWIDELVHVMLKLTDFVMRLAPFGVFAAVAAVITTQGLGVLVTYGKFIGGFYLGLALLWVVLIAAGYMFLKGSVFTLLKLIREPIMLAFSTASSEAA